VGVATTALYHLGVHTFAGGFVGIDMTIAVALALAAASFVLIERPFLRLKDRFEPRMA
jgi:hypothetical protein